MIPVAPEIVAAPWPTCSSCGAEETPDNSLSLVDGANGKTVPLCDRCISSEEGKQP